MFIFGYVPSRKMPGQQSSQGLERQVGTGAGYSVCLLKINHLDNITFK